MSDSPVVAELLASTGCYTHVVVDHEHSPTSIRSGQEILRAVDAANCSNFRRGRQNCEPIVRLPSADDPAYVKKVLDGLTLPGGVIAPMVDDAAAAQAFVESARYPAQERDIECGEGEGDGGYFPGNEVGGGTRGCAVPFVRGSSYGYCDGGTDDYMARCRDDLLVMVQVETPVGVSNVAEIAAVEGVDGIFLGPFDLSCAIGRAGQFEHPDVVALIGEAERAVRRESSRSNCFLAGFRTPGRSLREMVGEAGYKFVCGSVDMGMLKDGAARDLVDLRSATTEAKSPDDGDDRQQ